MELSAYQKDILLPEIIRVSQLEGNENVSSREVAKIIMRTLSLSLNIRIARQILCVCRLRNYKTKKHPLHLFKLYSNEKKT